MYLPSKHAEMHSNTEYTFASLLLKENACFLHFTKNISQRRRVIVVATCFLGRLNLILARTLKPVLVRQPRVLNVMPLQQQGAKLCKIVFYQAMLHFRERWSDGYSALGIFSRQLVWRTPNGTRLCWLSSTKSIHPDHVESKLVISGSWPWGDKIFVYIYKFCQ
jgi:hypothetical protein